jgi:hypothetical protein
LIGKILLGTWLSVFVLVWDWEVVLLVAVENRLCGCYVVDDDEIEGVVWDSSEVVLM